MEGVSGILVIVLALCLGVGAAWGLMAALRWLSGIDNDIDDDDPPLGGSM